MATIENEPIRRRALPRVQEIVFDCSAPALLARFWGELLEVIWTAPRPDWAMVDATPLLMAFQRVPEAKSSPKNRLHIDVQVESLERFHRRAVSLGAATVRTEARDSDVDGYIVLRDPEENEFCLVADSGDWMSWVHAEFERTANEVERAD
ncbi:VOC family protein [Cellulosimicrobium cellulans]|uniref:VOC family protein n=1 Tax=Cellulosimicrobium cellulans TaxID=1710 RepID=UPI0036E026C8